MKNNLLTEITHIKKLMGLTESSNEECEQQLEKAGYKVYSKIEQKQLNSDCEDNQKIKCVKDWLDSNGISSSNYTIANYKGLCFIRVQSDDSITQDGKAIKKKTHTFWSNGDTTYIRTFDVLQIDNDDSDLKYSQFQFKGKYECNGSDFNYNNMFYQGVYKFKDTSNLIELDGNFMVKKSDGSNDKKVSQKALTNGAYESSSFQ